MIEQIKQALEKSERGGYHLGVIADEYVRYLIGEVERLKVEKETAYVESERLVQAEEQVEKLQNDLKWYADERNHKNIRVYAGFDSEAKRDKGERARIALERTNP